VEIMNPPPELGAFAGAAEACAEGLGVIAPAPRRAHADRPAGDESTRRAPTEDEAAAATGACRRLPLADGTADRRTPSGGSG